jgi:hypothetical protein
VAAESLIVLVSAANRKARPPSTENGHVADKGIGDPLMMKALRARVSSTPWGATSKGVGNLMRRGERECWESHEVRRAGTGAAASELVLEMLAAKRKVRSPCSEDACTAQRERRCFADD